MSAFARREKPPATMTPVDVAKKRRKRGYFCFLDRARGEVVRDLNARLAFVGLPRFLFGACTLRDRLADAAFCLIEAGLCVLRTRFTARLAVDERDCLRFALTDELSIPRS